MNTSNSLDTKHPQVKSKFKTFAMLINIQLVSINMGYVLSYLTLSFNTLFEVLNITDSDEKTESLSIINAIMPLGCFCGVLIGHFLKKGLSNKHCIYVADIFGMMSALTLIPNKSTIILFRFILGIGNGISSLIMPIYMKSLCPEQFYMPMSLVIGYGLNSGLTLGQISGVGYIFYGGAQFNWWRVVFMVPPVICLIRSTIIFFIFNYDSPSQLILAKKEEGAKSVIQTIYQPDAVEGVLNKYKADALSPNQSLPFTHIFTKEYLTTLSIGVVSMFTQIWCGSFAVFYYSGQIFDQLADGDIVLITVYTICIGCASLFSQFSTSFLIHKLGSKYLLMVGSILIGCVNFSVGILAPYSEKDVLFATFAFLVLLIVFYALSLGPVGWSIVPSLNDSDGQFFVMESRWAQQAILVFLFPYMVRDIGIIGVFMLFGTVNFLYTIYTTIYIKDSRGKSHKELLDIYRNKYSKTNLDEPQINIAEQVVAFENVEDQDKPQMQ